MRQYEVRLQLREVGPFGSVHESAFRFDEMMVEPGVMQPVAWPGNDYVHMKKADQALRVRGRILERVVSRLVSHMLAHMRDKMDGLSDFSDKFREARRTAKASQAAYDAMAMRDNEMQYAEARKWAVDKLTSLVVDDDGYELDMLMRAFKDMGHYPRTPGWTYEDVEKSMQISTRHA